MAFVFGLYVATLRPDPGFMSDRTRRGVRVSRRHGAARITTASSTTEEIQSAVPAPAGDGGGGLDNVTPAVEPQTPVVVATTAAASDTTPAHAASGQATPVAVSSGDSVAAVSPVTADKTVEPVTADKTVEPVTADKTVEPVTASASQEHQAAEPELAAKPALMTKPAMPRAVRAAPKLVEPTTGDGPPVSDKEKPVDDTESKYYTKCGRCNAVYAISQSSLPARGAKVQCTVCGNQWYQQVNKLMMLREGDTFKEMDEDDVANAKSSIGSRRDGQSRARGGGSRFTIFVGNLPYSVGESAIREVFESVTTVVSVRLAMGPENRSKGFAFVDVPTKADMDGAVEKLSGFELEGRPISVREGKAAGR